MKAIIIGNVSLKCNSCDTLYESITKLDRVEELKKLNICEYHFYISYEALHFFVGADMVLRNIDEGCVFIVVGEYVFRLADENSLLESRETYRQKKDLKYLKAINCALICFDFIKRRVMLNSRPSYIQFESTNYCNAKCIMCFHFYSENNGAAHLTPRVIRYLKNELDTTCVIALHGLGEPFINPDIEEIIKYYATHQVILSASTNLSRITPQLLELINAHFGSLEISCDGATKATFETIRKNISFDDFIRNLAVLNERCPKLKKKINMVIMRQNIHEMCQMVELGAKMGIDTISFSHLQPDPYLCNYKDGMYNYPNVLNYYCQQAYVLAKKHKINIYCPIPEGTVSSKSDDFFCEEAKMKNVTLTSSEKRLNIGEKRSFIQTQINDIKPSHVHCRGICEWVLSKAYVDLNGNLSLCCCRPDYGFGMIDKENTFESIWNGELFQKVRSIFYSNLLPEPCLTCGSLVSQRIEMLKVIDEDTE